MGYVVLTDELLDYLGEKYVGSREEYRWTFAEYVEAKMNSFRGRRR